MAPSDRATSITCSMRLAGVMLSHACRMPTAASGQPKRRLWLSPPRRQKGFSEILEPIAPLVAMLGVRQRRDTLRRQHFVGQLAERRALRLVGLALLDGSEPRARWRRASSRSLRASASPMTAASPSDMSSPSHRPGICRASGAIPTFRLGRPDTGSRRRDANPIWRS